MKIVILAGKDNSTNYMFNGLKKEFDIEKVILEEGQDKKQIVKRRIKKFGLLKFSGQIIFIIYSKFLLKASKNKIETIKKELHLNEQKIDEEIVRNVSSVNSHETKLLLQNIKPDIVVVNGTRIISKEILNSTEAIFINTHSGITPKYRGVHGGYWALANNDKENCGTTVHIVDSGIDTGGIIYQQTINVTKKDNYCTYPLYQTSIGIEMMKKSINDYKSNDLKTQNNNLESNLWYHPDIITYLKNWITKGVK